MRWGLVIANGLGPLSWVSVCGHYSAAFSYCIIAKDSSLSIGISLGISIQKVSTTSFPTQAKTMGCPRSLV